MVWLNKIKSLFSDFRKSFVTGIKKGEILCAAVISVAVTLILEMLGRRDLLGGFIFLFEHPLLFLYNVLIVLVTVSLAFFMKKRFFGFAVVTLLWMILGVTNFVLQSMRVVPLTSIDFSIVTVNLLITYIGIIGLVLLILAIAAALLIFFFLYRKLPEQRKFGLLKTCLMLVILSSVMVAFSIIIPSVETTAAESVNINDAYEQYGFAYGFAKTFVEKGVEEPEDYSREQIETIVAGLGDTGTAEAPNIIIVQLESFFDAKYISGLTYSADPCPVFTHLKETCISGFLTVPYIGAGTVNTEFEILSGMDLDYFGLGEYPYKTVLQKKTCETVASVARGIGLRTAAIHNYEGTFYSRNTVYSNLGFERFIPMEFMSGLERNRKDWVKDKVLLPYIEKTLAASEERDLIFCVTAQSHGAYAVDTDYEYEIKVSGDLEDPVRAEYEYYLNEIHEVDMFIGALVSYIESSEEPTVIVLYGDHLPCLTDLTEDCLTDGNMFTTEYVIYSNYGLEGEDRDLEAYQLSSYLLDLIGVKEGIMFRYHSIGKSDRDEYEDNMMKLEYDMLYGENYAGAVSEKTDMIFGIDDISVSYVSAVGDSLYVHGTGFTEFSVVYTGGFPRNTTYISPDVLMVKGIGLREDSEIEVKQVASDGHRY